MKTEIGRKKASKGSLIQKHFLKKKISFFGWSWELQCSLDLADCMWTSLLLHSFWQTTAYFVYRNTGANQSFVENGDVIFSCRSQKKKIRNQNTKMATSVDENDSDVCPQQGKHQMHQLLLVTASLDKGGPNTKKMKTWTLAIIIGPFKPKHLPVLYWFFSDGRLDKWAQFPNWNGQSGKKCKWKGRGKN